MIKYQKSRNDVLLSLITSSLKMRMAASSDYIEFQMKRPLMDYTDHIGNLRQITRVYTKLQVSCISVLDQERVFENNNKIRAREFCYSERGQNIQLSCHLV